jgi:cation diffusion facilitator CzcD-associated flavoprotein CzcO
MPSISQLSSIIVPMDNRTAFTNRKLRIATIGAGFSGLLLAHKFQHQHPELQEFVEHVIYEAREGVGGTWRANTYPGVQCDIPSMIYAFPFDPNPEWSKFYSDGDEILEYMVKTAEKWGLTRDIRFNTRVVQLDWLEEEGKWKIKLRVDDKEEREETADILISAQGFLSQWKWPNIEGIHDFKGHKTHSAHWDHDYDYKGKRIGIIGNGSSGIQILPQLAKLKDTTIVSYQKGPTWISASLGEALGVTKKNPPQPDMKKVDETDSEVGSNFNPRYTDEDKERLRKPEEMKAYRKKLQHGMNKGFKTYQKDGAANVNATKATVERMRQALDYREDLCKMLIPDWDLGCRRLTPGEGYLESFLLPNVSITQSPIQRITATGIQTADKHHELDVIVCATGFDVSHIPHYPVTGRNGVTLAEQWKDEPESYLSLACPNMPNYFIFTGPNATVGHGTLLTSMDWSSEWMIKWIRKIASENIKSVAPKQSATDEFVRYGDEIHRTLVWTGGCSSWYKNHRKDGRVTATFPGSALLYREMIRELRPEDFEIEYRGRNRFVFMGNGFTELEVKAMEDESVDLAFYVEK